MECKECEEMVKRINELLEDKDHENPFVKTCKTFLTKPRMVNYVGLAHFTNLENLESIFSEGLIPTRELKQNNYVLNGKKINPGFGYSHAEECVCMFDIDLYPLKRFFLNSTNIALEFSNCLKLSDEFIDINKRIEMGGSYLDREVCYKGQIPSEKILSIIYDPYKVKFEEVLPIAKKFKRKLINAEGKRISYGSGVTDLKYAWAPGCIDQNISEIISLEEFLYTFYDEFNNLDRNFLKPFNKELIKAEYLEQERVFCDNFSQLSEKNKEIYKILLNQKNEERQNSFLKRVESKYFYDLGYGGDYLKIFKSLFDIMSLSKKNKNPLKKGLDDFCDYNGTSDSRMSSVIFVNELYRLLDIEKTYLNELIEEYFNNSRYSENEKYLTLSKVKNDANKLFNELR